MGVKVRQKDGKWYVFINHQGKRKAKCVGDSKRAAEEEVKRKLEAKLTLGEFALEMRSQRYRPWGSMQTRGLPPTPHIIAKNPPMYAMQASSAITSCLQHNTLDRDHAGSHQADDV